MAIRQGFTLSLASPGGEVRAVAWYDDANGQPSRVDLLNTTGRPFRVRLALADGSRQVEAVIQAGSTTVNIAAALASRIDMRPYGDDVGELPGSNPTQWQCEVAI